ncbi:MAG: MarR family transcriptional regulator [Chloroflexi bacterium]|nr:MarR family transcriptional regulator [Chloroflexota bacterium]
MPTHYKGTPEEVLALDTFIKLSRAADSVTARLNNYGTLDGLTSTQFGVLEALCHLGPMCQGTLSQKLLKSTGNMTLVIDNLEKRGLVYRERSSTDRRQVTISLTPEGEAVISRIFPQHVAAIVAEMGVLTAGEQEELGRLCRKLGLRGSEPPPEDEPAASREDGAQGAQG